MGIIADLIVSVKADFKDFDKAVKKKGTDVPKTKMPVGGDDSGGSGGSAIGALIGGATGGFIGVMMAAGVGIIKQYLIPWLGSTFLSLIATAIYGPFAGFIVGVLSFFTGVGLQKAIKKGMDNSQMYSAIKDFSSGGLGAAMDLLVFGVLKLTNALWNAIPESVQDFLKDPLPALQGAIEGAWKGALGALDGIWTIQKIFVFGGWVTWLDDNLYTPVKNYLDQFFSFSFTEGFTFDWSKIAAEIEVGYDAWIKPALVAMQPFLDLFGQGFDVPEDLIRLPKDIKMDIHGKVIVDKVILAGDAMAEGLKGLGLEGFKFDDAFFEAIGYGTEEEYLASLKEA